MKWEEEEHQWSLRRFNRLFVEDVGVAIGRGQGRSDVPNPEPPNLVAGVVVGDGGRGERGGGSE